MRKQRVLILTTSKRSRFPVTSSSIVRGGAAPRDMGLQTEIGRTSKVGSSTLPEETLASMASEGKEEAPTFKILPRVVGQPCSELGGFRFMLLFFFASTSGWDRSSPRVGFTIRGSKTEGEEDLGTEGFMAERGEDLKKGSWTDLALDELGISDLMSSE